MSYIAGITTLVNPEHLVKGNVLEGEASCKDIELRGKYIIFKTDNKLFRERTINTLFNAGVVRKVCDYIIISEEVILVCELKSNNEGHMKTQIKNSAKFVKYLLDMVKEHCKINVEPPPIKYVCFGKMNTQGKQNVIAKKLAGTPWEGSELYRLSCSSTYHLKQFN